MKAGSGKRVLQAALMGAGCLGLLLGGIGGVDLPARAEGTGGVSVSIRHRHQGSEEAGGGCYRDVYHEHSDAEGCYDAGTCVVTTHGYGEFWSGDLDRHCSCHGDVHSVFQNVERRHSSCGAGVRTDTINFKEYHGPGSSDFTGYDTTTHSYRNLACTREEEVVDHALDCGEEEGGEVAVFTLTPDASGWTRELTLTASVEVKGNITLDGEAFVWNGGAPTSQASFPVDKNGTYTCRLNAGEDNDSAEAVASVAIANIDRIGPEMTQIGFSREWTSGNVTVEVRAEDLQEDGSAGSGLAENAFRFDGSGSWGGNSHTYTENGTYLIQVRDMLGNVGEKSVVVENIDRTAPALHVSMDQGTNVRSNRVTLSAEDLQPDGSAGSGLAEDPWSFDGGKTWGRDDTLEVKENTVLTVAVRDTLGNVAKTELAVSNIDTTPPEFTLSLKPEGWSPETTILVEAADKNDAGMQGSGVSRYSYDGGKSWGEESSHTVTENGTYHVRVKDALGNVAEDAITVTRVDHTVPEVSITYNKNTADGVRIQVTAKDLQPDGSEGSGLADRPYSFDEGQTWTSDGNHWVDENGEYPVWVKDNAGNIKKETVRITNMDHTGPTLIIRMIPDEEEWTTGEVTALIAATDSRDDGAFGSGLAEYPYSYDGGKTWTQETERIFAQNGVYPVWAKDRYGNVTEDEIVIRNIDVTPPRIGRVVCDGGKNLALVHARVEAEDLQPDGSAGCGLADTAYSFDGGNTWTDETIHIHDGNGTYEVLVRDRLGNVAHRQYSIGNIDEYPPRIEEMEVTRKPEGWTREDVILTFSVEDTAPDGSEGSGLADAPWSYDGGKTWQEENQCVARENGVYQIMVKDRCGNTAVREVTVSNIDRTGPVVTLRQKPLVWLFGKATVTIEAKDIQPDGGEGCGAAGEAFSLDGENWTETMEYQVEEPGTYTYYVRDLLENVTEASITVKRAALPGGQTTGGGSDNPDDPGSSGGSDNSGGSGDSGGSGGSGGPGDSGPADPAADLPALPLPYPGIWEGTVRPLPPAAVARGGRDRKTERKPDRGSVEEEGEKAEGTVTGKDASLGTWTGRTEERDLKIQEEEAPEGGTVEMAQGECICDTPCGEDVGNENCPVCREHPEQCDREGTGEKGGLPGWVPVCLAIGSVLLILLLPVLSGLAILFGTDEDGGYYPVALKRIRKEDGRRWMDMNAQQCESDGSGGYLLWCGLWGKLHEGQILEIVLENRVVSEAIIGVKTGIRL